MRSGPRHILLCVAVGGIGFFAAPAAGGLIEPGLYKLFNHPDGSAGPPPYGLRLDELFDVTGGHDKFTFDFEHPDAEMYLEFAQDSIHIFGTAFGGLDAGDGYDMDPSLTSVVELDFVYAIVGLAGDDDDLIVTSPTATNMGTLTWLDTGEVIDLFDKANDEGFTFRFGNGDDDQGHRGFTGLSGWGWLNHHVPDVHIGSSDWIFTAEFIPAPPALLAVAAGALALGRRRRR